MNKKRSKRIWHPVPAPWRNRISLIERLIEDAQRQIEVSIGWRSGKKYYKRFTLRIDREFDAKLFVNTFNFLCSDCKAIEIKEDMSIFGYLVSGVVEGVAPKLKRIRIGRRLEENNATRIG